MLLGASFLKTVFMVASTDDRASMRGSFQTQHKLFIDIVDVHNTCRQIIKYSSYIIDIIDNSCAYERCIRQTNAFQVFILTIDIRPNGWQIHWHGAITDNMTKNL